MIKTINFRNSEVLYDTVYGLFSQQSKKIFKVLSDGEYVEADKKEKRMLRNNGVRL